MSRTYRLLRTDNPKNETVLVEVVGKGLKKLPHPTVKKPPRAAFVQNRKCGRTKTEGWTRWTRAKAREHLERHRLSWLSAIHFVFPSGIAGEQAEKIFHRFQRWLSNRKVPALGIVETPNPHGHIAVGITWTQELEAELRSAVRQWWLSILHREPDGNALKWEPRQESTEAILKYLSKARKGGRGVKGKARWLTFLPYFKTNLPHLEQVILKLTEEEAETVLHPDFTLTFGAEPKLAAQRAQQNPVANDSEAKRSGFTNPVANVTLS